MQGTGYGYNTSFVIVIFVLLVIITCGRYC
ncbi:MAG: sporulation protein YjcZ [Bacilli bacterium]|nr:sporulation protein YjcZ [Bacilli bacterium]